MASDRSTNVIAPRLTPNPSQAHVVADQSAVLEFLSDPKTHGLSSPPIRIDTHGAVVFLAGENAYKLKRAVKFPFMNLSTLDRRRAACEAEIAVNALNAPTIYLGAIPVNRGKEGLRLGGDGKPIEWLVHMRRFDELLTLDHVAEREGLPPALLAKLVSAILASHARAPLRDGAAAAESLRRYLQQNVEAFSESPDLFPAERVKQLTARSKEMLAQLWELLLERGHEGFVRRCHGDLHLRNIVPTPEVYLYPDCFGRGVFLAAAKRKARSRSRLQRHRGRRPCPIRRAGRHRRNGNGSRRIVHGPLARRSDCDPRRKNSGTRR